MKPIRITFNGFEGVFDTVVDGMCVHNWLSGEDVVRLLNLKDPKYSYEITDDDEVSITDDQGCVCTECFYHFEHKYAKKVTLALEDFKKLDIEFNEKAMKELLS